MSSSPYGPRLTSLSFSPEDEDREWTTGCARAGCEANRRRKSQLHIGPCITRTVVLARLRRHCGVADTVLMVESGHSPTIHLSLKMPSTTEDPTYGRAQDLATHTPFEQYTAV